jgi:tetratricopeptide (TPR) repeat protein
MLGAEFARIGLYKEALPHLKKANDLFYRDSSLYNLGYVYEQSGDYEKAKKYYREVFTTKKIPYLRSEIKGSAYKGMARVLVLHDKPENAKEFSESALKMYPNDGTYWSYLAISEYKLNNQEAALRAAERAKVLLPNASTNKLYKLILNKKPLNLE